MSTSVSSSIHFPFEDIDWAKWTGVRSIQPSPEFQKVRPGAVRQADMSTSAFSTWMAIIGEAPRFHNKQWQFFWALNCALEIENSNGPGQAIGFGVGLEPVPAALAARGWQVVATDYFDGEHADAWNATDQLATAVEQLNARGICDPEKFRNQVSFRNLDMNRLPVSEAGNYDLVWSLCALGHIGGYQKGLEFIEESCSLLKPGGIAVHTTEMDLTDKVRFDSPGLSLYQRTDLEELLDRLSEKGYVIRRHDFSPGTAYLESWTDRPPYGLPHLRLEVADREIIPVVLEIHAPL